MVKVRIQASQEAFDSRKEDSGDFVVPKPGYYVLTVADCEPGYKADDTTKPYLKFTYKITGVGVEEAETKENYGNIWDYMSFSPESDWKRAEVLLAYGIAAGAFDGEIDTDDFVNRKVLARLKHERGQSKDDPKQAKVARLMPYGYNPTAEDAAVDYGGEDTEVFGEEPATDEAIYESAVEPTRRAELEAMDLKALGAIYKDDHGGDPRDLVVKVAGKLDNDATKTAVINAILGGTNSEPDEEDPF